MSKSKTQAATQVDEFQPFSHKEILQVLSGLLMALFVANLSGTIVANALPTIIKELEGTQQQYTWIVTASLLASTASTPVWGKLADLFDKKKLLMVGIAVFILGSILCGFATSTGMLIIFRVVQGLGFGALQSLVQTIIATIIPPRERGRYMAYTGATIAVATVLGPLAGGWIVDQSWLGWRWCYWSSVVISIFAVIGLQLHLRVPHMPKKKVSIDWFGTALITLGVSLLLIWISFADHEFNWMSWQTAVMLPGSILIFVAFVFVELNVKEPIIDMRALIERNTALAVVASIAVGIGMFGASVFLGQYYQISRGYSPTESGLMMVPMMLGVLLSSIFIGRLVSKVGRWKPFVVVGSFILMAGFILLSTMNYSTPLWLIAVYMTLAGLGVGMTMQNLVLAVQNSVSAGHIGSSTATVTFFRSFAGAVGIQVLGSVYSHKVLSTITERMAAAKIPVPDAMSAGNTSLDLTKLPPQVAQIVKSSYGDSIGLIFLVAAVISILGVIAVCCMKGTMLRSTIDIKTEPTPEEREAVAAAVSAIVGSSNTEDSKTQTHDASTLREESKPLGSS